MPLYFTCFIKYTKSNLPKSSPIYQKEKYYRSLHALDSYVSE